MAFRAWRWLLVCWCAIGCEPRSQPLEPGECGSVAAPREPNQPLEDRPTAAVQAFWLPDGSARILLGPIIRRSTNAPVQDLEPGQLSVSFESEPPVSTFTLGRVSPDAPAELDVVLLLDTSATMGWAIEAAKATARPFAERLQTLGFEPRFGGLEFGDEVRTRTDLASLAELEQWLGTLTPIGGGDEPSSALDAVYQLRYDFAFRPTAARQTLLVTQSGLHELDDGTTCARFSFFAAARSFGSFFVAIFPEGRLAGIHPERLTDAMGGLAVPITEQDREALLDLPSVSEIMGEMYTITVPAEAVPEGALAGSNASIAYPLDGEELSLGFWLQPL